MPELPEVETIVRRLRGVLPGKSIARLEVLHHKSFVGEMELVVGHKIVAVERRSKIISIELDNGLYLLIHLKMTGQLLYEDGSRRLGGGHPTADFMENLPSVHTRVILTFSDESVLYFNDQRIFGWIDLVDSAGKMREFAPYGPDITDAGINSERWIHQLGRRSVPIKQVVMDNAVLAGVGNIYASDALHLAKINPARQAKSLSREEAVCLLHAMQTVIALGIEYGGATIHHFATIEGLTGHYQDIRRVYARENEPCAECNTMIIRIKQAGRSTFYCPSCQR